jgi:hypothetical protein
MSLLQLDNWQKKFIETKGDKILCSGRQVGKTETCARDCIEWAIKTEKKGIILMTAPQQFQAETLFNKTLEYLMENYKSSVKMGKDRPTKSHIYLKKGITILCKTAGDTGFGLRSITSIRKYVDECSQMPESSWEAIDPQDLTTGADTIYLSTPFGMKGRFWECWINKNGAYDSFTRFSIDSETCVKEREISKSWTIEQREKAIIKIEQAKARMTKKQFMQEFMGQFIEDLMQWFPDELIIKCQGIKDGIGNKRPINIIPNKKYYLGVDVGGRGGDETTLEIVEKLSSNKLKQVENIKVNYEMTTMTEREIIHQDNLYHFKKIYIDDGGMGTGVFDHLLEIEQTKRKTEAINNARRSITYQYAEKERGIKLIKNDLYENLLCMMERGEIEFLDDIEIFQSLKSVQFEMDMETKQIKIFGNYTHIAEGLIRAAWCVKDKSLNPFIA